MSENQLNEAPTADTFPPPIDVDATMASLGDEVRLTRAGYKAILNNLNLIAEQLQRLQHLISRIDGLSDLVIETRSRSSSISSSDASIEAEQDTPLSVPHHTDKMEPRELKSEELLQTPAGDHEPSMATAGKNKEGADKEQDAEFAESSKSVDDDTGPLASTAAIRQVACAASCQGTDISAETTSASPDGRAARGQISGKLKMESLPPEIISNIVPYLIEEKKPRGEPQIVSSIPFPPLATISRRWQPHIEAFTFQHLILTSRRLSSAEEMLTPTRLSYIRHLQCDFLFPAYETVSTNNEDWDDHAVFLKTITQLFGLLERIPVIQSPVVDLFLKIPVPWKFELFSGYPDEWPLYLDFPLGWEERLPELPMIDNFKVERESHWLLFAPRSICLLASKMTKLRAADLYLSDSEKRDESLRIQLRNDLADTLDKLPISLEMFALRYHRMLPRDHRFEPSSILPPGTQQDILSQALHRFTQRSGLKDFVFSGSVDPTIFWPSPQSSDTLPHWPTLKSFSVYLNGILPSGEWVMKLRPGRSVPVARRDNTHPSDIPGDIETCRFRDYPIYTIANDFFVAAARCAARMPKVEYCSVSLPDAWLTNLNFSTHYEFDDQFSDDPCLTLTGHSEPELSQDTYEAWREAIDTHNQTHRLNFSADDIFALRHRWA
ncbi:hypothetical protein NM208_g8483 [Fusarium decemcellulare]|uniref:Uncharacterized protein n=2 Tax=Fusarium decemcellulare TaxID=57161 RepID=A0ACC1S5Q7_9HYPO|nr:hypothetical protein NM208_g8606 [Fusarium decemcellulare]KAJ3532341.1 hypothetical protein NM208_g8483 [Fusarium decemcellulare]